MTEKKNISILIPIALHKLISARASESFRSVSQQLNYDLLQYEDSLALEEITDPKKVSK